MRFWRVWSAEDVEPPADETTLSAESPRDAALRYAENQCRYGGDTESYDCSGGHPIAVRLPPELGGSAVVYLVGYVGAPAWPGGDEDLDLVVLSQASLTAAEVYLHGDNQDEAS